MIATASTRRRFATLALALGGLLATSALVPSPALAADDHPVVLIDTSAGPITVELDRAKAPITVDNFLKYVDAKFYDGLVFHRVMEGFMIQGGGMSEANDVLTEKQTIFPKIKNESGNGIKNERGAISMARTAALNSATSQFYINHVDNPALDQGQYCAFGKVTEGMSVVDAIAATKTTSKQVVMPDGQSRRDRDVPVKPVTIKSIRLKK